MIQSLNSKLERIALDPAQETDLDVLRKIESADDQKSLARDLGFSVGKVNYIVRALMDKGLVKAERFAKSDNKKGYKYLLTRKGVAEKIRLTRIYVEIKRREYETLRRELEESGK